MKAQTLLDTYISTTIDADADLETRVEELIDRWDALGTSATVIEAGSIGNLSGVTDNPHDERVTIQSLMRPLVPFRQIEEAMNPTRGGGAASSIPVIR